MVIEHVKSAIGHKTFGHTDALGCLVVLYDGGNDAWQSQCRTVECMAKFCLLGLSMAEPAFQTIGLIAFKIDTSSHFFCAALYTSKS